MRSCRPQRYVSTMPSPEVAETAVREYLLFLEDPSTLIDQGRVEELRRTVDEATDPLDRLRALARLEAAQRPPEAGYRDAFIAHAVTWATENDVPGTTFLALGVERQVLEEAGLLRPEVGHHRVRRRRNTTRPRSTSVKEIQEAAMRRQGEFTLRQLADQVGGSPMTLRKALNELVDTGEVARLGPAAGWTGPGRAPIVYRQVSPRRTSGPAVHSDDRA